MRRSKYMALAVAFALILSMLAGCTKGGGGDGGTKEPVQTPSEGAVVVSTAREFLDALDTDTEIFLKAGTYNLSEAIASIEDRAAWDADHPFVFLNNEVSSATVEIICAENLKICGEGTGLVEIIQDDVYADVLHFSYCNNVSIDHVTMGHKEAAHCDGNVIEMEYCRDFSLDALDLYGCGTYGICAYYCDGLQMKESIIRDCSYGIMYTGYSSDFNFADCEFKNCREYDSISSYFSELSFENCSFKDNYASSGGFVTEHSGNSIYFKGCSFGQWETDQLNKYYCKDNVYIDDKCSFDGDIDWVITAVDSAEGLFFAINEAPMARGATIILEPGYYNLSEYINTLDVENYNGYHSYVQFEEVFDGYEPVVYSQMFGIVSRSGKNDGSTTIVVDPRYAYVFTGYSSSFGLRGLTIGHTELGECRGGVVRAIEGCNATIADCDLYGCGTIGITADSVTELSVLNTRIHDCSDESLELSNIYDNAIFSGCDIDGGGLWIGGCEDARLGFYNNKLGEWESNLLYFRDDIDEGNNEWHEITYYPEYPDVDPGEGWNRDYLINRAATAEELPGAWYAVWFSDDEYDVDTAMPYYDSENDELFQLTMLLYENGTGQLIGLYDDPVDFDWNLYDPFNADLIGTDGNKIGSFSGYADERWEDSELQLRVYVGSSQIWFQNLNMDINL